MGLGSENLLLLTSCLGRSLANNRAACNGMEQEQFSGSISQGPLKSLVPSQPPQGPTCLGVPLELREGKEAGLVDICFTFSAYAGTEGDAIST